MSTAPPSRLASARIYRWKPIFVNVPPRHRLQSIPTGLVLIQLGVSTKLGEYLYPIGFDEGNVDVIESKGGN
jgi:hypothetical protein